MEELWSRRPALQFACLRGYNRSAYARRWLPLLLLLVGMPLGLKAHEGGTKPESKEPVSKKRKVLVLDGRPRWETRYIRKLFEGQQEWETNCVDCRGDRGQKVAWSAATSPRLSPRAPRSSMRTISSSSATCRARSSSPRSWSGCATSSGSAVGRSSSSTASAARCGSSPRHRSHRSFRSSERPRGPREIHSPRAAGVRKYNSPAFSLVPEKAQNAEVWRTLEPPHWLSGASVLPGGEVLLEAVVGHERRVPADGVAALRRRPRALSRVRGFLALAFRSG